MFQATNQIPSGKWPIEIDGLPLKKHGDFPWLAMLVITRGYNSQNWMMAKF